MVEEANGGQFVDHPRVVGGLQRSSNLWLPRQADVAVDARVTQGIVDGALGDSPGGATESSILVENALTTRKEANKNE